MPKLTKAELPSERKTVLLDTRKRHGKTRKDRDNDARKRNIDNKIARADWIATTRSQPMADCSKFPLHTCNGKRSRALRVHRRSARK